RLPGIKKFRGPSMAFYLTAFSVIVLGAMGLQSILDYNQQKRNLDQNIKKKLKNWLYTIGLMFVILIAAFLIIKSNPDSFIKDSQKIKAFTDNVSNFWSGLLISALVIILSIILFYRMANQRLKVTNFVFLMIPLICFDLWRIDSKFLKTVDHPNVYYAADEVVNFLQKDTALFRVHPLYDGMFGLRIQYEHSNDGLLDLHNIQNAGGYAPNPLQTYQDFIGAEKTVMFHAPNLIYPNFINLLNIKYLICPQLPSDISKYDATTQSAISELRKYLNQDGFELVFNGRRYTIYRNNKTLPRAFLVPSYEIIEDKNQLIERLKDNNFNPSKYVLLSESLAEPVSHNDSISGSVKITSYAPNKITLETEQDNSGFLVLSENFHPEWLCKVDGRQTKIYRAYHTLRAIHLEKGKHKIEFFYRSIFFEMGLLITVITSLFCLAVLITVVYKRRKSKTK
ncbi:MAG: YfhO family protein, partial [candidate division WOR-3 bacterium]|nr:YfhO family protein [candidate division WOR-3 bacterium]